MAPIMRPQTRSSSKRIVSKADVPATRAAKQTKIIQPKTSRLIQLNLSHFASTSKQRTMPPTEETRSLRSAKTLVVDEKRSVAQTPDDKRSVALNRSVRSNQHMKSCFVSLVKLTESTLKKMQHIDCTEAQHVNVPSQKPAGPEFDPTVKLTSMESQKTIARKSSRLIKPNQKYIETPDPMPVKMQLTDTTMKKMQHIDCTEAQHVNVQNQKPVGPEFNPTVKLTIMESQKTIARKSSSLIKSNEKCVETPDPVPQLVSIKIQQDCINTKPFTVSQSTDSLKPTSLATKTPVVPIYKSKLVEASEQIETSMFDDNNSHVFDYFSNSQEGDDEIIDENQKVIEKLKQQNKIHIVKKKPNGIQKKRAAAKPKIALKKNPPVAAGNVKKVEVMALQGLKDNLLQVLREKTHRTNATPKNALVVVRQQTTNNPTLAELDDVSNTSNISMIPLDSPMVKSKPLPLTSWMKKPQSKVAILKPSHQSTPIRSNISTVQSIAAKSPWRVTDEQLPRTCYYASSNTDNLPTYSSDVIQVANGSGSSAVKRNQTKTPNEGHVSSPAKQISAGSISVSFVNDLNHSNIENISPVRTNQSKDTNKDRVVTVLGQRNANPFRSPLKSLAIRNVLLSPFKTNTLKSNTYAHKPSDENMILHSSSGSANESIERLSPAVSNKTPSKPTQNRTGKASATATRPDYFGFDSGDEEFSEDSFVAASRKNELINKMHELKRLLPSPVRPARAPVRAQVAPTNKSLFACPTTHKSDNIRNVFAAAAEQTKTVSSENQSPPRHTLLNDSFDCIRFGTDQAELSADACPALFETMWPEKNETSRRSYTRVPKRKRYVDSTDEDDDFEEPVARKKRTQNDKRKVKEAHAMEKELNAFADEFNSICEQVEQYELVVEKSA